MSKLVVVGLPARDEKVNRVSSEKAAHVTLLFLGEGDDPDGSMALWVQHCVETSFRPLMLEVRDRGPLGPDQADVLFFGGSETRRLEEFRSLLLKDRAVFDAYSSVEQYPTFTPHLTLGYPHAPAREDDNQYGMGWVTIDRIALWTGDSEGPEFKPPVIEWEDDFAMSDIDSVVDEIVLAHYGTKGMKWGVRKDDQGNREIRINSDSNKKPEDIGITKLKVGPKTEVRTNKGGYHDAHPDAISAKSAAQKQKKSGVDTLSNAELQALATRLNLEQQVRQLQSKRPKTDFEDKQSRLTSFLMKKAVKQVTKDPRTNQVSDLLKKMK